uniref:Proliferating cell nuclear antigen n=1 Tax=Rhinella marina erythrocytic-like virus TaxID=2859906 RepID=A0A8F6UA77_9VIRU|nr:proliferating cell nuclear antigen [Rhinella marina erythrocytic-like virus]
MTLFKCQTKHTTIFKYMFDMLFHNIDTVPICISEEGFAIFDKTDKHAPGESEDDETIYNESKSGYIFNIKFPHDKFDYWKFTGDRPVFFGIGTANSQDFKELTNKSIMEMSIDAKKSSIESLVLKITVANTSRNLIKKFVMYSEEIPFFTQPNMIRPKTSLTLQSQDFTSLCKGFKTGPVFIKCDSDGFSIANKLDGVREKCFMFPEAFDVTIDATLTGEKLMAISKIAMCVESIVVWIDENYIIISGASLLGIIEVLVFYNSDQDM